MANINELFIIFLTQIYTLVGNDLGLTIILFTVIVRSLLVPLTLPSINAQKEIRKLQPELAALKKKFGADKAGFQAAQLELYKKYNVNPLSGCLPQLVQIGILFLLYHGLTTFLGQTEINGVAINTQYYWLNLSLPDPKYVIPVLAGVTQLILSVMVLPGGEVRDVVPNNSKNKAVAKANEKEEDAAEMAAMMQQQMLFLLPLMTAFFATRFPSGLGLYWIATTIFSIAQQWLLSGPGGLTTYWQRLMKQFNPNA